MGGIEIILALGLGLVVNEFSDVSPWLARKLVAWSAGLRYGDTARADIRAEELAAVINDRPGKLFKLGTGVRFASAALAMRLRRFVSRDPQPADEPTPEELLSMRSPVLEDEPSSWIARYLFPTERYRGEWKRHWIHPAKGLGVIGLYAVLGVWAATDRIKPQYVGWVVAAILVGAVLLAAFRVLVWYFGRFVITNKRLMSTEGILFRRVAMLPLLRVTDLRYVQSPIARMLNYGTFHMESASRTNEMRRIVDLPQPNELYLRLVEEMYEPSAVEARLGQDYDDATTRASNINLADLELDPHTDEPKLRRVPPDPAAIQQEIIYQMGALSTQMATLAAAIDRLTTAPESLSATAAADPLSAADDLTAAVAAEPLGDRPIVRPRQVTSPRPGVVD